MHTFAWIVLYTTVCLISLTVSIHVLATDEGLATIRARLTRSRRTSKEGNQP